jgi:hypothetical protein
MVLRRCPRGLLSLASLAVAAAPLSALAARPANPGGGDAAGECRVVEMELTPTADLQIVIWLEDAAGSYIDTAFITRSTGSYGLGNRPGIMDFKSGPLWPYGRRISTFPVWAHRHGIEWPAVVFQDDVENNLSHNLEESSAERHFCRPIRPDEAMWDAESCASRVFTDKGKLDPVQKSNYPPRSDVSYDPERDNSAVEGFAAMNPFDAVSRATPVGGEPFSAVWPLPGALPDGTYLVWMEVAREFDQNPSHDYPSPDVTFNDYGLPYRGQPSLVYKVEIEVTGGTTTASTLDYVGYGDPAGADGALRPPDATISTASGTGAGRLLAAVDGDTMYRLRVTTHGEPDAVAPGTPVALRRTDTGSPTAVSASFEAPGDDGLDGQVAGYEVRYLAGATLDDASWDSASQAAVQILVGPPGTQHDFALEGLLPQTRYQVGVRAYDECFNRGPIAVLELVTSRMPPGEVDACFIATAAYGTVLASEVTLLRDFRDRALRSHVAGELLVEAYYTFGPLAARFIAPSELLRRAARDGLSPLVDLARRTAAWLPLLR